MTYISWSSDFALYLEDYLIDEGHTRYNGSVWHKDWSHKYIFRSVTYISWSSDFALYLEDYLMVEGHTLDIESVWHKDWPHKIYVGQWPIFHCPVILLKGKGSQKYTWIVFKSICKTEHFDANCIEIGYLLWRYCDFMFSKWLPMEAAILKSTWKFKIMKLSIFLKNMHTLALLTTAIFAYYVNNHFMRLFQE